MEIKCIRCKKGFLPEQLKKEDICARCWEVLEIDKYIDKKDIRVPNVYRVGMEDDCRCSFNPIVWVK